MGKVLSTLLTAILSAIPSSATPSSATPSSAAVNASNLLTPYDPGRFVDLYSTPGGPIAGATYIFNPTVDWQRRMAFDFRQMRAIGVNTVGLYNLVQMTDADRDALFAELERNRLKAVVRIEWYDRQTFAFTAADADRVLRYYDADDTAHGYTALLSYLVRRGKLSDVAYLAVNMPVDDGMVSGHFATSEYPDGRSNPLWAARQPSYAERLLTGLRAKTGSTEAYLSVFYGWDQSYPTPSYAGIAHPADGYFLNNYSYPISAPANAGASTAELLNVPRLAGAMDKIIAQYGAAPKVIEYGFHTVDFNNGVIPNQNAGLVQSQAAKKRALTETTAYYQNPDFQVRGTLYFAENLFKPEGNPPATMDWALGVPVAETQAEDTSATRYYRNGSPIDVTPVADSTAWGGAAITLANPGDTLAFQNLAAASVAQIRYRAAPATTLSMSVNGATARTLTLPAATDWSTFTVPFSIPLQGTVTLQRPSSGGAVTVDWFGGKPENEAELTAHTGSNPVSASGASRGEALTMPAGQAATLTIDPVRGGTRILIRYCATVATTLRLSTGTTVTLPATGGAFASRTVDAAVTSGTALTLTRPASDGDLLLDYLTIGGQYEAESSGGLYNGAHAVASATASEGALATSFDVLGASVVFAPVRAGSRLTFRYAATRAASMTVLLDDVAHPIAFPATGGRLATAELSLSIPENATLIVQRNAGDTALGLSIDAMSVS
ncbi:hypothetical protein [Actinoplanes sp. NPDC051851]|uniref:hypothetical protein n=1 Tax=Actinoplanes sp. NPDC051851 TaxID=3154753 RepID=UPI00344404A9